MAGTIPTEPRDIASALAETFPELGKVAIVGVLGSGFNSVAVETDGGAVFRIAKTEGTAQRYARERRLLPALRPHLPVSIPEPRWFAERSPRFPYGVIGYPKLDGRPLLPDHLGPGRSGRLASQVAAVLLALQRFPAGEGEALGLSLPAGRAEHYPSLRKETLPALRDKLSASELRAVSDWWDSFLADEAMRRFEPVLYHGDFWFANILVDDGAERVAGLIDWEHAALGDPALDFSTLLHLGDEFTGLVLAAYTDAGGALDPGHHHRMRRLWEVREFYGVLFGVRFDDQAELDDSVRKLRAGPILRQR